MRKIVLLITTAFLILSLSTAALAAGFKATGGYSALADEDGNGTSFLSGGLRYEADRFLAGGSYAMDLDYSPAPLLQNSDDLLLVYGGPRLLDLGLVKLAAIGGYYKWANQVTDNLLTGASLRTEMNSYAVGLQASAGLGPVGAELLYLKGVRNELQRVLVNEDVDTSWLELRGSVRLSDDIQAYLAYQVLDYAAGGTGDELQGFGVGLTAAF